MEPWYKVVVPREEVREGRSFNPDEFAIHLEQVVAGTAPPDYRDPKKFMARTCFTRALREYSALVLRRLAGKTENTAPVLTLVTQFGGGKTHILTTLYHIVKHGKALADNEGIKIILKEAGLSEIPKAKVAVFVGSAWDPKEGCETPWLDIARQLADEEGVAILGSRAKNTPPGTEALGRLFEAAGGSVLILFDETLNFLNRYRDMADAFYAFIQNLTVATTGTTQGAAVISLPRSQVEMTDWDLKWQEKITKLIHRVAKDLIANDEAEISEVIRKRLFEDQGNEKTRKKVARGYAEWCFERRAQLPSEWTAVDTATSDAKAKAFLQSRFEACYPFHPATLSVFQRKWQALQQYQQTRGTLAMLAQWISLSYRMGYQKALEEPLITLGSAPLDASEFLAVVLGQLGESRLNAAINADISGEQSHAKALDADTKGALKNVHQRVAKAMLFESSGGMVDKVAHLPELRFALGGPDVDTTSIDNAAFALESKAFFVRKVGTDGFRVQHKPTLKKVVSDRRASLDEADVKNSVRTVIKKEFEKGANVSLVFFPDESASIQDTPRLTLVIMPPEQEWDGSDELRGQIAEWTKNRGDSPRLYPGALIWCVRKPGRDLKEKVETWMAWKRVEQEIRSGVLGAEFDHSEKLDVAAKIRDSDENSKDEVWAGYRFVMLADNQEHDGIKVIDLGAGHASGSETLCGRVLTALKSQALLNESIGAGYIERNWPPALKESGTWPLSGLRQSFLNGTLTRLQDPDEVLRKKIVEFVSRGDFGLASGQKPDGGYSYVWFSESISLEEVTFDADVFLLTKSRAKELKIPSEIVTPESTEVTRETERESAQVEGPSEEESQTMCTLRLVGDIPPEVWNRLGTKIIPKIKSYYRLGIGVNFTVNLKEGEASNLEAELRPILNELGLTEKLNVVIEKKDK